jgi:electron transport complex protein RnfG
MNSVVKQMFAVLILVGALSGLVLAASYSITKPLIDRHDAEELKDSIFVVLPGVDRYEKIDTPQLELYRGFRADDSVAGYAFVAEGSGFQGAIRMMVGIDAELKNLLGMRVLAQAETPGLGAKITEEKFQAQFEHLSPAWSDSLSAASPGQGDEEEGATPTPVEIPKYLTYVKNITPDKPNEIQAITGATISSEAVISTINQHLYALWGVVGDDIQQ